MEKGLSVRRVVTAIFVLGVAACSSSGDTNRGARGTNDSARSAALTADSVSRAAAAARTIAAGTAIEATIQEPVSSRSNRAGQAVKAIVSRNVLDAGGAVAIPGGAPIVLTIATLRAARGANAADGSIALTMTSVMVRDTSYAPTTHVSAVAHTLAPIAGAGGDRDVVVAPGTPITITLTQPFKMATK